MTPYKQKLVEYFLVIASIHLFKVAYLKQQETGFHEEALDSFDRNCSSVDCGRVILLQTNEQYGY